MLKELQAALKQVDQQANAVGRAGGRASGFLSSQRLDQLGKNLQWTGRQLEYNFTLPLVLAGAAAGKWAVQSEAAMVRVRKVYGDGENGVHDLNAELAALDRSFLLLSNRFGVHREEVIEIAGSWAQAGSAGAGLARATRLTLETMILGEMDATRATEGLIAIQSAYRFNTVQLKEALADLNVVENQTSISFEGLIDVMTRSAGTARTAGINIEHLAAMAASLVPATGSAAQAGNALRTILSRIMAPTRDAAEIFGRMGINIFDATWQASNGVQRIERLAGAFDGLTQAQKVAVSATIASRWQVNRFDILMSDIALSLNAATREQSTYAKALEATANQEKALGKYTNELRVYLQSQPQAFKILTTQIQNALARGIMPLLPAIIALMTRVAQLTEWFANLDPAVQQLALGFLVILAVIGPLAKYFGAFMILGGIMEKILFKLSFGFIAIGKSGKGAEKGVGLVGSAMQKLRSGPLASLANGFDWLWKHSMLGAKFAAIGIGKIFMVGMIGLPKFAYATGVAIGRGLGAGVTFFQAALPKIVAIYRAMDRFGWMMLASMQKMWALAPSVVWFAMQKALGGVKAAYFAMDAFGWALLAGMQRLWRTVPFIVDVASQGAVLALRTAWGAMSAATIGLIASMDRIVRTIPMLFGIAGQGVRVAWTAAMAAIPATARAASMAAFIAWNMGIRAIALAMQGLPAVAAAVSAAVGAALGGGWVTVAIAAVVVLALAFRKQIGQAIQWVIENFNRLPSSVVTVFRQVVNIVSRAAKAVYEWMSYLNPFARHSPSLVESVNKGVDTIMSKYKSMDNIGRILSNAARAHNAFLDATAGGRAQLQAEERGEQREDILAYAPGAGPALTEAFRNLDALQIVLTEVGAEVDRQEVVVAKWEEALDAANRELDQQEALLDRLKDAAQAAAGALDAAKEHLDDLTSNVQLTGYGAMEDAIFANEMAQKRLRLEMLKMEEAAGGSLDDILAKMAALSGEIETLRGESNDLRLAGAGSDIIGPLNAQIDAMEAARNAMGVSPNTQGMQQLKKEMDELARKGEMLDLEKSLNFDEQLRAIEKLTNPMREMGFNEMISAIKAAQIEVNTLTAEWRAAEGAVAAQQSVVDDLTAQRDAVQLLHNVERDRLEGLRQQYQLVNDQIDQMESSINEFASAAAAAKGGADDRTIGQQLFDAGAGADFEIPGGDSSIGREGGLAEIEQFNADMERELEEAMKEMGKIDLFGPFRQMWDQGWEWVKTNVWPKVEPVVSEIGSAFTAGWERVQPGLASIGEGIAGVFGGGDGGGIGGVLSGIGDAWDGVVARFQDSPLGSTLESISGMFSAVEPIASRFVWFFREQIQPIFSHIVEWAKDAWKNLQPELAKWGEMLDPLTEALGHIARAASEMFKLAAGIFMAGLTVLSVIWAAAWPVLIHVLKPIWDMIVNVFKAALQIVRGVIEFFLHLINGDWKEAGQALLTIIDGIWDAIYSVFSGAIGVVVGFFRGLVEGVINAAQWLWEVLVGHSIIPDIVNGIIDLFKLLLSVGTAIWNAIADAIVWVWENIVKPVWAGMKWYIDNVLTPVFRFLLDNVIKPVWEGIQSAISTAWNLIKTIFDAVKWYIENVISPVFKWLLDNIIKPVWEGIKSAIGGAWDIIKGVFNTIKSFIEETLAPVFTRLKDGIATAWDAIKGATSSVWGAITDVLRGMVNFGIRIINTLIRGIQAIANAIPGVNITIREINEMGAMSTARGTSGPNSAGAAGNMMANGGLLSIGHGFKTKGAQAIVGEGSKIWPEYVIPTDPRYRGRAMGLAQDMMSKIGLPQMAMGGIIGDALGAAGGAVDWVRNKVGSAAMAPFNLAADTLINQMPDGFVKDIAKSIKGKINDWVRGVDDAEEARGGGVAPGHAPASLSYVQALAKSMAMQRGWIGNQWDALYRLVMNESGWRTNAQNPTSTAYGLFQFLNSTWAGVGEVKTSDPIGQLRAGFKYISQRYGNPANALAFWMRQSPHWYEKGGMLPFANGGIVNKATNALIGEAGPEAVLPLNKFWAVMGEGFTSVVGSVNKLNVDEAGRMIRTEAQFDKVHTAVTQVGVQTTESMIAEFIPEFFDKKMELWSGDLGGLWDTKLDKLTTDLGTKLDGIASAIGSAGGGAGGGGAGVGTGGYSGSYLGSEVDASIMSSGDFNQIRDRVAAIYSNRGVEILAHELNQAAQGVLAGNLSFSLLREWLGGGTPGMATGGIVLPRPGGTLVRLGERGYSETVIPNKWVSGQAREIHFHGDLVFPNVKDGDDAESFIRNLESMEK